MVEHLRVKDSSWFGKLQELCYSHKESTLEHENFRLKKLTEELFSNNIMLTLLIFWDGFLKDISLNFELVILIGKLVGSFKWTINNVMSN